MLKIHDKIGSGTFSEIYQVTYSLPTEKAVLGHVYAVKLMSTTYSGLLENELSILRKLPAHTNIIKYIDDYANVFAKGRFWNAIVFEYVERGDLFSIISRHGKLHENVARIYYNQIVDALRATHAMHIFHRDLKLENILVDATDRILICDWGLAIHAPSGTSNSAYRVGTVANMSPEMLCPKTTYRLDAADRWASNCVLFTCVMGHPPFIKAHPTDWHYSSLLKNATQFWKSIHKYDEDKQTPVNISDSLYAMLTHAFQSNPQTEVAYEWMDSVSE
jgi:serine/threonine protein kinase